MLVLSRKIGERIFIGVAGEIVLTVVEVSRDKVRFGVEAPKDIPVHREEIWMRIHGQPPQRTDES